MALPFRCNCEDRSQQNRILRNISPGDDLAIMLKPGMGGKRPAPGSFNPDDNPARHAKIRQPCPRPGGLNQAIGPKWHKRCDARYDEGHPLDQIRIAAPCILMRQFRNIRIIAQPHQIEMPESPPRLHQFTHGPPAISRQPAAITQTHLAPAPGHWGASRIGVCGRVHAAFMSSAAPPAKRARRSATLRLKPVAPKKAPMTPDSIAPLFASINSRPRP